MYVITASITRYTKAVRSQWNRVRSTKRNQYDLFISYRICNIRLSASADNGTRAVAKITAIIKTAYLPSESIFQLYETYELKNSVNW